MKGNILKLTFVLAIGSFALTSCGEKDIAENEKQEQTVEKGYYCPMKCEGDKVHSEPGSCSVCGMDLVEVK